VYALDAASGDKIWEFATGDYVYSSPAVGDVMFSIGSYDNTVRVADRQEWTMLRVGAFAEGMACD
jgi:outer membrane protein assembly factor BamB